MYYMYFCCVVSEMWLGVFTYLKNISRRERGIFQIFVKILKLLKTKNYGILGRSDGSMLAFHSPDSGRTAVRSDGDPDGTSSQEHFLNTEPAACRPKFQTNNNKNKPMVSKLSHKKLF